MNKKEENDFDSFLSKVEEIGSIIKDMSSKETEISKKGMEKADQYLNKEEVLTPDEDGILTVYSKSSLNKKALEASYETPNISDMSAEKFMAAVEKDAQERLKRKYEK